MLYLRYLLCGFCFLFFTSSYAQDIQSFSKKKPLTIHGSFSAGLNYHADISKTKDSFSRTSFGPSPSYFIQANPVLSIYGMDIPFNLLIASQNKNFSGPFNRYGLSPNYKWVKLHLGWRSLSFSQFTLNGQQILGAGFELTPGKFRAAFIYGKFNNAVTDISLYNNLNNNIPVYKRKGFAAKLGYGSAANFIEFSYLQAKDDSNSLKIPSGIPVAAAANQVAGIKGQVTIFKSLSFRVDAAGSYYTRNISSGLLEVNNSWAKLAAFTPRVSSRMSFAGEAGLNYQFKKGSVQFKYRRVDPNYQSMGAFYMQTDIEQYTAGFSYAFLRNKLHLKFNFGIQKNNLAKTAVNDSKRTIGNFALNYSPSSKFGVDVNYSNYGISQQIIPKFADPSVVLRYDSVRISQVNQSLTVSPHLFINRKNVQHLFNWQTSLQALHNNNPMQSDENFTSTMSSFIYSLVFPHQKINISNTLNYFNTAFTSNKSSVLGYNLGISKSIDPKEKKTFIESVNLSLTGGYFENRLNSQSTGNTISVNPAISLMFQGKQSLQLTNIFILTKNKNAAVPSNNQMMFTANYNISF